MHKTAKTQLRAKILFDIVSHDGGKKMLLKKFGNHIVLSVMKAKGNSSLKELDDATKQAIKFNEDLILKIVNDNKDTEYGKLHHFAEVKSIEDYKRLVPVSNYDDYAELIERGMDTCDTTLYTAYPIVSYAITSGSVGVPKYIPQSELAIEAYRKFAASRVFGSMPEYYEKMGEKCPEGYGLNTFEIGRTPTKDGKVFGGISGTAVHQFKQFLPYIFTSPLDIIYPQGDMNGKHLKLLFALAEKDLTFMISCFMTYLADEMNYMQDNWELLCDDIEKGRINPEIKVLEETRKTLNSKLKADPERANELRAEFKKGFDTPIVPRIWPKLKWVSSVGSSGFMPYTNLMRSYLGPDVTIDFLAYAASEAIIGAARTPEDDSYVIIPQSGFYEFVPEDATDYSVTYTIGELEVGKKYEILVTNLSGLYRYRINDVVEVVGFYNESPKIKFAYRKSQLINIAGEKLTEKDLQIAVDRFAKETGLNVIDFCVYADLDVIPGRCVVLIEPKTDIDMSKLGEYEKLMDEKLKEVAFLYNMERDLNNLSPLKLLIQQPQSHALYREMRLLKGVSENQIKPVRILDTPMKINFFLNMIEK